MYKRWYDKYPDLKSLMLLLESVNEEHIEIIAQDFIQIMPRGSFLQVELVRISLKAREIVLAVQIKLQCPQATQL